MTHKRKWCARVGRTICQSPISDMRCEISRSARAGRKPPSSSSIQITYSSRTYISYPHCPCLLNKYSVLRWVVVWQSKEVRKILRMTVHVPSESYALFPPLGGIIDHLGVAAAKVTLAYRLEVRNKQGEREKKKKKRGRGYGCMCMGNVMTYLH